LLAGSIGSGTQGYWIQSPDDVAQAKWQDLNTAGKKYRDQRSNEWSAFFQDDWKITRGVTLNLGLRYEYYGPSYLQGGFTSTAIGQGYGLFEGAPDVGHFQQLVDAGQYLPFKLRRNDRGPNSGQHAAMHFSRHAGAAAGFQLRFFEADNTRVCGTGDSESHQECVPEGS
jgi:outer membrane receptor protein involved in Fe transport